MLSFLALFPGLYASTSSMRLCILEAITNGRRRRPGNEVIVFTVCKHYTHVDGFHGMFHYGNWRAKGHVMWVVTNQQAAW